MTGAEALVSLVRAGLLDWATQRELPTWPWTVNDPRIQRALLDDPRVEAVITDDAPGARTRAAESSLPAVA